MKYLYTNYKEKWTYYGVQVNCTCVKETVLLLLNLHTFAQTNLSIAPEEAIRYGDVNVKGERLQDAGLHGDKLLLLVCIITNIKEVIDTRWAALLQEHQNKL